MPRNVVLCLDGTGNQIRASGNTNVVRLFRLLESEQPDRQIVYYDPGVGTFSSAGAWTALGRDMSRLFGLAFGAGLRTNLADAYRFLMENWNPGDRIYLFGFSRGAFCARALTGLLQLVGVLRPGSQNLVQYAVAEYARRHTAWSKDDWREAKSFAGAMSRRGLDGTISVPIEFLGLWDTVKAPGVLRRSTIWPYTRELPNVRAGRHAVSIHDRRRPYREYLIAESAASRIDEVWFSGVHSDVGGGFPDKPRLSDITLDWMVRGAQANGLLLKCNFAEYLPVLTEAHAEGPIHSMGKLWLLAGTRTRPVPPGAKVHASVRVRCEQEPTLCDRFRDPVWADEQWLLPVADLTAHGAV